MNHEETRQAVVAFLDQFIDRGAAQEVIALRNRLSVSGHELSCRLAGPDSSAFDVYEAMRRLFWDQAAQQTDQQRANFGDLYVWTQILEDGGSLDPAQWHDWCRVLAVLGLAVPNSRPPQSPPDRGPKRSRQSWR